MAHNLVYTKSSRTVSFVWVLGNCNWTNLDLNSNRLFWEKCIVLYMFIATTNNVELWKKKNDDTWLQYTYIQNLFKFNSPFGFVGNRCQRDRHNFQNIFYEPTGPQNEYIQNPLHRPSQYLSLRYKYVRECPYFVRLTVTELNRINFNMICKHVWSRSV